MIFIGSFDNTPFFVKINGKKPPLPVVLLGHISADATEFLDAIVVAVGYLSLSSINYYVGLMQTHLQLITLY
jgi:hypothetical protein